MRRPYLAVVLLGALSCKQACGLDSVEADGGAGVGANPNGANGTGADGAGPNGGAPNGGAPNGGAGLGGNGGAGGSGGAACTATIDQTLCDTLFDGAGGSGLECGLVWDACEGQADGAAGGGCGIGSVAGSELEMTPDVATGFWFATDALFLHAEVTANTPFVAYTLVTPHRTSNPGMWPQYLYGLAGLAARDASADSASASLDWIKAEYGTLTASNQQGLRTARGLGVAPGGAFFEDDVTVAPSSPGAIEIALCRTSDAIIRPYYREVGGDMWIPVNPETPSNPTPLSAAVHVGMVTAAGSAQADITAEYSEFRLVTLTGTATEADCLCTLESITN